MPLLFRKKKAPLLNPKDIDPDAVAVLRRLSKAGHTAYLVGGGVRDLLIGRQPKDFDIATDARPRQIKSLFRNAFLIGRRFRLALIRFGDKQIETATFRRSPTPDEEEASDNASLPGALYQEADNRFGTPEEDAQRRDFTVNALFYDIESNQVIDYTGGLRDVEKKVLRSIGDPNIRFREDPVRMLRAVRLSARLDFRIHADSAKAIARHAGEIMQAAKPRLFEEILRLFSYNKSEAAFRSLWTSGLMRELLPPVEGQVRENGRQNADLWLYLRALDAEEILETPPRKNTPETILANPLRLAVLLAPCFFSRCADDPQGTNGGDAERAAETLINDVLVRPFATPSWRIPRLLCEDTLQILASAAAFKNPAVKRTRHFRKPWFPTALRFWRICALARRDKAAMIVIESWQHSFDAFVEEQRNRRPQHPEVASQRPHDPEGTDRDSLFPPRRRSRPQGRRNRSGRNGASPPSEPLKHASPPE